MPPGGGQGAQSAVELNSAEWRHQGAFGQLARDQSRFHQGDSQAGQRRLNA